MSEDIDNLLHKIESLKLKILIVEEKLSETRIELKIKCPHETHTIEETYYHGGYDYTDHTDYEMICNVCGTILDSWTKDHGNYS